MGCSKIKIRFYVNLYLAFDCLLSASLLSSLLFLFLSLTVHLFAQSVHFIAVLLLLFFLTKVFFYDFFFLEYEIEHSRKRKAKSVSVCVYVLFA